MGQISPKKIRQLQQRTGTNETLKKHSSTKRDRHVANKKSPARFKTSSRHPSGSRPRSFAEPKTKKPKRSIPTSHFDWHWSWTHPYLMTAFGFGVGSVTALLHGSDLIFGLPFHGLNLLFDCVATFCGIVLAAMSAHTYRELPKYASKR